MGRTDFAQLLDEKLQEAAGRPVEPVSAACRTQRAAPPHPLLFAAPFHPARGLGYVAAARAVGVERRCAPPRRILTTRERHALDALNSLGAGLSADFTARELRSAYRQLARRYHPDRHVASGDAAQSCLSRQFAEISNQHQLLTTVIERGA